MSQPTPTAFYEKVLTKEGFATAAAAFLIWWLTMGVSGNIDAIKGILNDHVAESTIYLRGICLHTATNDTERADCVPPRH